jgi:serine kinase of HPr protein (carbohydrate metabolism regulator)
MTEQAQPLLIHATTIAIGARGVLIRGPSGAGKSDLALRCMAMPASPILPAPVALVADDYTLLTVCSGRLRASAPDALRGKLEVRGVGIVEVAVIGETDVHLVCDLVERERIDRLPEALSKADLLGCSIPRIELHAFEASAAPKLLLALACAGRAPSGGLDRP